jgi:hypothetical protein
VRTSKSKTQATKGDIDAGGPNKPRVLNSTFVAAILLESSNEGN